MLITSFYLCDVFVLFSLTWQHNFIDASQLVEAVYDDYQPNVEKYRCVQCGKVFSDKSNCRRHVKLVHFGEKEPQDNCPLCQKLMLKKHINHHARNSCPQRQMYWFNWRLIALHIADGTHSESLCNTFIWLLYFNELNILNFKWKLLPLKR